MAYPIICPGGYSVPEKGGVMEIVGIGFSPVTVGMQMQVQLRDAWEVENDWDPEKNKYNIISLMDDGNKSYFHLFSPAIKTRRGIRATTLTNATRIQVYVR